MPKSPEGRGSGKAKTSKAESSSQSKREEFNPTMFLSGIEGLYTELDKGIRGMGVNPEENLSNVWGDATKALHEIRNLSEKYKEETRPRKRSLIADRIQDLGSNLGGKISERAQRAALEYLKQRQTEMASAVAEPVIPIAEPNTETTEVEANSSTESATEAEPPQITPEAESQAAEPVAGENTDVQSLDTDLAEPVEEKARPQPIYNSSFADVGVPESAADAFRMANAESKPEDVPEYVKENLSSEENTPKDWRDKLKGLINAVNGAAEGVSERFTKSREYLDKRAKEIDKSAEMSGGEKWMRTLGEKYNKLSFIKKLGIGATLGIGTAIGVSTMSMPLIVIGGVGLVGQRAFGAASMFLSLEKTLQEKKVGESFQLIGIKERAALDAMLYTVVVGTAISQSIEFAREHNFVERTREWLGGMLGHHEVSSSFEYEMEGAEPHEVVSSTAPEAPAQASVVEANPATSSPGGGAPEAPAPAEVASATPNAVPAAAAPAAAHAPEAAPAAPLAAAKLDSVAAAGPAPIGNASGGADGYVGAKPEPVAAAPVSIEAQPAVKTTIPSEYAGGEPLGKDVIKTPDSAVATGTTGNVAEAVGGTTNAATNVEAGGGGTVGTTGLAADKVVDAAATGRVEINGGGAAATGTPSGATVETATKIETGGGASAVESAGVPLDPSTTSVRLQDGRLFVPTGSGAIGQAYAQENGVSVFESAPNKILKFLNTERFVEYTRDGQIVMHNDPKLEASFKALINKEIPLGPKGGLVSAVAEAPATAPAPAVEASTDVAKAEAARLIAEAQTKETARAVAEKVAQEAAAAKAEAVRVAAEKAAEAKVAAAQQLADEAKRHAEAVAREKAVLDTKTDAATAKILDESDGVRAGREAGTPAAGGSQITFEGERARLIAEEAAAAKAEAVRVAAEKTARELADTKATQAAQEVVAAKVEAARIAAEKVAREATGTKVIPGEDILSNDITSAEAAVKAQEEAAFATRAAAEAQAKEIADAATRVATEKATQEAAAAAKAEAVRVAAEAKAKAAADVAEAGKTKLTKGITMREPAPVPTPEPEIKAPAAPEPVAEPKTPPAVGASKPEASAPIPSGRVLNVIPTEQLDKMMTPEITKVAGVRKAEMLALFDMEGSKKGVNSAAWKAAANKPIDFLLAVNNTAVMKNLIETERVDAKYLGKPAEFLKEVLGIEKDAVNSDGFITERFGKLHNYLYDLALDKRYPGKLIPPLPKETVAAYVERASKVLALKWAR